MIFLGVIACKGMFGDTQCSGWSPMWSLNNSDPGHGNGVAVSDPNTMEMKVSVSPMGAGMLWGPQGMQLGKGASGAYFWGDFFGGWEG